MLGLCVAGGVRALPRVMRERWAGWMIAGAAIVGLPSAANAQEPSPAALIAAAKQAAVRDVDYGQDLCDGDMTVEAWLKSVIRDNARAITWTAGTCRLLSLSPIDQAHWKYCVQATMTLFHPMTPKDKPTIEIYLEKPDHGRPGPAYAFRGAMLLHDGQGDYERERDGFVGDWDDRFPPPADVRAARCPSD
jgi:hypothetical protein